MNWEQVKGKWTQLRGAVRVQWSRLTDDDVEFIKGERDKLLGKLQERYGYVKAHAEKVVDEWVTKLGERRSKSDPPRPDSEGGS